MGADAHDLAARWGTVHLVGVGGAGMSVVARLLQARGVRVQGSDATASATLAALTATGITTWVGHDAEHVAGADTVVVSTAVRETNPELRAARAAGLRVLHRSEALAGLMDGARAVAVAGAHGKTTTSGMIALALAGAGLDPSFAIGGSVRHVDGTLPGGHLGASDILVAEADESDGSFLNYAPQVAVVTNVEPDHLDHYGSREAFMQAFVDFAARVRPGGVLVACADDAGAADLARAHRGDVVTYGFDAGADVRIVDYLPEGSGVCARVALPERFGGQVHTLDLRVPGRHNAANATAALACACALGADPAAAAAALGGFLGAGRRFELRGEVGGVRVVDDYAHHPTEVRALLDAARVVAGPGRVGVLFQPHLFSRTATFADEFATALALADRVVVTDVYAAREDPVPGVTSALIVDRMDAAQAALVPDRVDAARALAGWAAPADLLLTVGAGDVTELGEVILAELRGAP